MSKFKLGPISQFFVIGFGMTFGILAVRTILFPNSPGRYHDQYDAPYQPTNNNLPHPQGPSPTGIDSLTTHNFGSGKNSNNNNSNRF